MPELEDVRHAHPIADLAAYDRGYADADLAGRLAEIVYQLRTTVGLTQTELARRTGTTQVAIARLEGEARLRRWTCSIESVGLLAQRSC